MYDKELVHDILAQIIEAIYRTRAMLVCTVSK